MKTCPDCGTLNEVNICYRCHRDLSDVKETVFEFAREIKHKGVQEDIDPEVYERIYPFSSQKNSHQVIKIEKIKEEKDYLLLILALVVSTFSFFRRGFLTFDPIPLAFGITLIISFFFKIVRKYFSIAILAVATGGYFMDKDIFENYLNIIKSVDLSIWEYIDDFRLISISIFLYIISEYTFLKRESIYKGVLVFIGTLSFAFFLMYADGFTIDKSIFIRYDIVGYKNYFISIGFITFPLILFFLKSKRVIQLLAFLGMILYFTLYPFENFLFSKEKIDFIYMMIVVSIFHYQKNYIFEFYKS